MTQLVKKNIKKYIYDTLKAHVALTDIVEERIYLLEEGFERDGEDIFPMVTYCRIAPGKHSSSGKRAEFFQVSAWAKTNLQAEAIKDVILDIFSRRSNDGFVNYVHLMWVNEPTAKERDSEKKLKINGIHSDFLFVLRDNL
jgi:hypothetical protein